MSRGTLKPDDRIVDLGLAFLGSLWNSSLGRMIALLVFSFVAIPSIIRCSSRRRLLIQYESLYSAFPAIVAKILLGKRVIGDEVILMSRDTRSPIRYVLHALDRLLIRMTDYITTSSTSTDTLVRTWFPKKPICIVRNGVTPTERERPRSRDVHELIFVGSLSSSDNRIAVENVLTLAHLLESKGVKFHICVVGGPRSYAAPYLRNVMVRRGRVTFMGTIHDRELRELYRRASIGLLPFFTPSYGGQRIKGLEYLAHELLVISGPSGFGWLPEIAPGIEYLEATSVEEMSDLVERFISNPATYSGMAAAGRELTEHRLSWEAVSKPYLEIVVGMMESTKSTG
jgi:glycosyltransferase involved in cell wall biosynthesis